MQIHAVTCSAVLFSILRGFPRPEVTLRVIYPHRPAPDIRLLRPVQNDKPVHQVRDSLNPWPNSEKNRSLSSNGLRPKNKFGYFDLNRSSRRTVYMRVLLFYTIWPAQPDGINHLFELSVVSAQLRSRGLRDSDPAHPKNRPSERERPQAGKYIFRFWLHLAFPPYLYMGGLLFYSSVLLSFGACLTPNAVV